MAKRNTTGLQDHNITFALSGEYQRFEQLILGNTEQSSEEAFSMIKNKALERNKKWTR